MFTIVTLSLALFGSADAVAKCEAQAEALIEAVDARASFEEGFWTQFAGAFAQHVEAEQREDAKAAAIEFWKPRLTAEIERFWVDTLATPLGGWWVDRLGCKAMKRLVKVDPDAAAETLPVADQRVVEAMIAAIPDFSTWLGERGPDFTALLMARLIPLAEADGPLFIAELESKGFRFARR